MAHRVVVDAPDAKLAGEDRIDFLVRMRNKALEPLFEGIVDGDRYVGWGGDENVGRRAG